MSCPAFPAHAPSPPPSTTLSLAVLQIGIMGRHRGMVHADSAVSSVMGTEYGNEPEKTLGPKDSNTYLESGTCPVKF